MTKPNNRPQAGATRVQVTPTTFLKPLNGKLRQFVKEATQTSKARKLEDSRLIHEELFASISGELAAVHVFEKTSKDETKTWEELAIYVRNPDDKSQRFCIQTSFKSGFAASFIDRLPNLKPGDFIQIAAYTMTDENGKEKDYLIPYVWGETPNEKEPLGWVKIPSAFTKENPNGKPQATQTKIKGGKEIKYDFTAVEEFQREIVKTANALFKGDVFHNEDRPQPTMGAMPENQNDDLPF